MKVGDIVTCCWGATMTLYDFYQISGFTASGKSVYLSQLERETLPGEQWNLPVRPVPGKIKKTKTCRIHGDYAVVTNFQLVNLTKPWDGQEIFYENHLD